jgi:HD-GYP domain-containing protein (c-di-GMP phosphodiesterase class II)
VILEEKDLRARSAVAELLEALGRPGAPGGPAPGGGDHLAVLRGLAAALEVQDPETRAHARRVADLAVEIGAELGLAGGERRALEVGGLLHDVGKLGVPGRLLAKQAPLTEAERATLREHARLGEELVAAFEPLRDALPAIRSHHERWDGQGYPDRLAAEEIPLVARIVNAADTWDACVSSRPYQAPLAPADAARVLAALRGRQLDPAVHDALLAVLRRRGVLAGPRERE